MVHFFSVLVVFIPDELKISCYTERDDLWDCIVISAADVEQKEGFERQIKQKLDNDELPKSVNYFVIADPGPSVGSGGASFHGAFLA